MMGFPWIPAARIGLAGAALWALLAAGCGPADIDRTYGKRRGAEGGTSVNGTGVLAGMFEAAGHRVSTWRRLSPKLEQFDVIVWAPDSFEPPSEEEREYLEEWLWNEGGRTLVYIGRDYDAGIAYWKKVQPQAPPEQTLEVARRLATAQAEFDASRSRLPDEQACDWFTLRRGAARRQVRALEGLWSAGIDDSRLEIEWGARYDIPDAQASKAWMERRGEVGSSPKYVPLLTSESATLISRVTLPGWDESQILVVTNGSFLLNLPLVNHEHRVLAGRLIAACGAAGKRVAFLESGPDGPPILDVEPDTKAPTGFEVFTVWPIGVVAMHFVILGITACFALLPVFGRPRHLEEEPRSDFGKHVEALGELLAKTGDHQYAANRVRDYHAHVRTPAT